MPGLLFFLVLIPFSFGIWVGFLAVIQDGDPSPTEIRSNNDDSQSGSALERIDNQGAPRSGTDAESPSSEAIRNNMQQQNTHYCILKTAAFH